MIQSMTGFGKATAAFKTKKINVEIKSLNSKNLDPSTRLLKQVTIENAAQADEIFSMLMGDDVEPRREFIEQNATYANIDA